MTGPIVTRGFKFGVKYIVTAGFAGGVTTPAKKNIYRVDVTGTGDIYRGSAGGSGKVYR